MIEFPDVKMCPKCGDTEEQRTIDSRTDLYGTKRRKSCPLCGHRFNTIEITMDSFKELLDSYEQVGQIVKNVGEVQKLREMRDLWDSFTKIGRSL